MRQKMEHQLIRIMISISFTECLPAALTTISMVPDSLCSEYTPYARVVSLGIEIISVYALSAAWF